MTDRPCVFIQTNHRQLVGALVSAHSLRRSAARPDAFDVRIAHTKDHAFLRQRDGQPYLREGRTATWRYDDLQSFTPVRFLPPELMGWRGRALVIDPDVFAVGDVTELLERDMQGRAVLCRARSGSKGAAGCMASSVMLLDCARLEHWRCEEQFAELFAFRRDYMDWVCLRLEPPGSIGLFEDEWNDFDRLTPRTKMLHNTKRQTQPWKTGLPVDFRPARKAVDPARPRTWLRLWRRAFGRAARRYKAHPDPAQERFFFGLLKECLAEGVVTEDLLRREIEQGHVRGDAFEVLRRTPSLAA